MKKVKIVKSRTPENVTVDIGAIPSYQSDAMCRTLIECISRFFENPVVQADYKRWKQERQQKMNFTSENKECI